VLKESTRKTAGPAGGSTPGFDGLRRAWHNRQTCLRILPAAAARCFFQAMRRTSRPPLWSFIGWLVF